jgi:exopolyphosphatase/pppGpp-phosphohydrolase
MHDLHVLLQKAIEIGAIHDRESRYRWRSWIEGESNQRLDRYRQKMSGKDSLWRIWRNRLPQGEQLKTDCIERLKTWAHFRDSDSGHSGRVAQTALQIHEGLVAQNLLDSAAAARSRDILHIAALLHAVGAAGRGKNRHKRSFRILCKLRPPIGLEPTDFRIAAFVVRYHRGALPTPVRKRFPDLSEEDTKLAIVLAGILRFAVTCTASRQMEIFGLEMTGAGQKLLIRAKGYDAYSSLAQKLARARHLLEIACGLPIIIQSWQSSK